MSKLQILEDDFNDGQYEFRKEVEAKEPFCYYNKEDTYRIENGVKVSVSGQKTNTFSEPLYK